MDLDLPDYPPLLPSTYAEKLRCEDHFPKLNEQVVNLPLSDEITLTHTANNFIPITAADKSRLYSPWRNSLIIKVVGRKLGHQLLKSKLQNLWKSSEELPLMNLGHDYFLIKFTQEQNLLHALDDSPCAIWVCLPELPTEFYDMEILQRIGGKIGTLLKMDTCTTTNSHGRYARLNVQQYHSTEFGSPILSPVTLGGGTYPLDPTPRNSGTDGARESPRHPSSSITTSNSGEKRRGWISNHYGILSYGYGGDETCDYDLAMGTEGMEPAITFLVPARGKAGGIAILWHADLLNITNVALTPQEIHCMIQALPSPDKWLFTAIYASNSASDRLVL
ncbi:hypothetical protein BC332_16985 [Capsicum chinense]|nr:hypothetical protein BC332_16985 [Capsicum chinense]